MSDRRYQIVQVTPSILCEMFRGHEMSEVVTDFPADARIEDVRWEFNSMAIQFRVWSSTFDELDEEAIIPFFNPTITSHVSEVAAIYRVLRKEDTV